MLWMLTPSNCPTTRCSLGLVARVPSSKSLTALGLASPGVGDEVRSSARMSGVPASDMAPWLLRAKSRARGERSLPPLPSPVLLLRLLSLLPLASGGTPDGSRGVRSDIFAADAKLGAMWL